MVGYSLVNILGGFLIVTSLMVILSKTVRQTAFLYAGQSLILVLSFVALAVITESEGMYKWAGTALATKVIIVPAILMYTSKKMRGAQPELVSKMSPVKLIIIVAAEVLICFVVVQGIQLPTSLEVKPALAVSLAHFFIGLTCIATQRNIVKQIMGYCLMENGSHLTLALLAPNAPELVEVGVATDAFLAVIVMVIIAMRIYRVNQTLDTEQLTELKG